jgi:hypothetical protein
MSNGYDLSGALAALEKQGFTPSLIMVERLFRYPGSQSTQNDHLGYWLCIVWERDGMVYEPQHLEKFLSYSEWRQVFEAHASRGLDMEFLGKIPEIPEGFDLYDLRAAVIEQVVTPKVIRWTEAILGYALTRQSSASCYMVMNKYGDYECHCKKAA